MNRVVSVPQWFFEALLERPDAIALLPDLEAIIEVRTEDDYEAKVDFS